MHKKCWLSMLILLGLFIWLPGVANARLSVSSPEGTLERADLIATATVMNRNYEDEQRQVTIRADEVLKGTCPDNIIKLTKQKDEEYGWGGFDFPEPGAKIFLLLGGNQTRGYWPAGDLNFLALVADGQVRELYQGSKIGINDQSWTQEDYAKAYDAFYQIHRRVRATEALDKMTKEQIAAMIQTQGKHDKDSYYIEGLSYDVADLDDDADWEIVAQIDGGVHLGKCFIFDKDADPDSAIIVAKEREVIPDVLVVTKTSSDYAHGQHIIWVEGRFKPTAGELYLTFLDANGQLMQSGGIRQSDEVAKIDDKWSFFRHKLIENTGKVVNTDKATIVFHLQKEGKNQKGLLQVPAKKPVGIFTEDPGKSQGISNVDKNNT